MWRFFLQNPKGLTFTAQQRGLVWATLLLALFFIFVVKKYSFFYIIFFSKYILKDFRFHFHFNKKETPFLYSSVGWGKQVAVKNKLYRFQKSVGKNKWSDWTKEKNCVAWSEAIRVDANCDWNFLRACLHQPNGETKLCDCILWKREWASLVCGAEVAEMNGAK